MLETPRATYSKHVLITVRARRLTCAWAEFYFGD
jgi:hypothetical protein